MKTSLKIFVFIAALSSTVIYSKSISKKVIKSYNNTISSIAIPSPTEICYQLASR
jgi:hypothetical protein